jgi:uncharacterized protein involved in response to NO
MTDENLSNQPSKRIGLSELGREPYRVFFPAAVLAGLIGVALWPLHFGGLVELYPGQTHARIMAYGFFGGFIFGFLGTAMPRMLSARPLGFFNVLLLLGLHLALVCAFTAGSVHWGDRIFATFLLVFAGLMIVRARERRDLPPPGFVLVGMAFLCVLAGSVLAIWHGLVPELDARWVILQRLLTYQGFVLLPILGIGPFILPRFFGMPSAHNFPETLRPTPDWTRKALLAFGAGVLIVISFFMEAWGRSSAAYGVRFLTTLTYLLLEFPFGKAPRAGSVLGASLRTAFVVLAGGFLAIVFFPGYRTGLLHLTLMGGFAVITFTVATRVVFGHSGNLEKLKGRNRWMIVAVSLMLVGMATRVSGDIWRAIMVSHYNYGAALWVMGVLLWGWKVLPKVLQADPEE